MVGLSLLSYVRAGNQAGDRATCCSLFSEIKEEPEAVSWTSCEYQKIEFGAVKRRPGDMVLTGASLELNQPSPGNKYVMASGPPQ